MPELDRAFAGAIPDIYNSLLVPMIFAPYAADLAARVAGLSPSAILETAAGTGVVPRALAPLLGPQARYVITDLNPPMLERARSRQPADPRLVWQPADAMALPFEDESFDIVLCQFGVMFLPDRVAGYAEARRVLRPGGRFLFSTWDSLATNDFPDTVSRAVAEAYPDTPPRFVARIPHGYHDTGRIRADTLAAGFAAVDVETVRHDSVAESPMQVAVAYCQGTPLRSEIEARGTPALDAVTARAADALTARFGAGAVTGRIQAHLVTAQK